MFCWFGFFVLKFETSYYGLDSKSNCKYKCADIVDVVLCFTHSEKNASFLTFPAVARQAALTGD